MARKLTCKISQEANRELTLEKIKLDAPKGKVCAELMELVLEPASFDVPIAFDVTKEDVPCSLNVSKEWFALFAAYRQHHTLSEYRPFFKDALLRGLSIRIAGNTPRA